MKKLISIGIILALLTVLILPISVASQPASVDKYAVIIGYNGKPCKSPIGRGNNHIFATTCARLLRDILTDNEFSQKNIIFLTNNKATKAGVLEAINGLKAIEGAEDEVVVAFFGHGGPTGIGLHKSGISHSELKALMADLDSQKQLIVIDTCGSAGAIIPGWDGITLNATNRIVLTSTVTERESSIFSWHLTNWCRSVLLWGLKEGNADFNGDGMVSIQEAGSVKGGMSDGYGQDFFL